MKPKYCIYAAVALVCCASLPTVQAQNAPRPAAVPTATPPLPAGVAAEVNGDKFLVADLNRMVGAVTERDPSAKADTPAAKELLKQYRDQIIDNWVDTRLLAQEATRRKIAPKTEVVDDAIKGIREEFKSEQEFKSWLQQDGKTTEDLRKTLADEMSIRELAKQLTAEVVVSGEDFSRYYEANKDKFSIPEQVRARHILLAVNPNAPATEKERVRRRAQDLIKQINSGGDFVALAKANTDDPASRESGGNLGVFGRKTMVSAFDEAAFTATVNRAVGPVETDFGYHIIKVEEKFPARLVPLAEVRTNPEMKAFLLKRKVQQRLEDTVAKLKQTARIKRLS